MRTYLRYVAGDSFGVISSSNSNALLEPTGKLAITASLQNISVWNLRNNSLVRVISPEIEVASKSEIVCLALSPNGDEIAAGYACGIVCIFRLNTGVMTLSFNGHKTGVNVVRFNSTGTLLATGSKDTEIVIWDIVGEKGLFRLKGHKGEVTDLYFIDEQNMNLIVSASKDTLVKVWDLETQHCVQTIVGHRSEVWALDIAPDLSFMVTGASDRELRIWKLNPTALQSVTSKSTNNESQSTETKAMEFATYWGSISREVNDRCTQIRFHQTGMYFGVQAIGKQTDIYRIRSEEETIKKMKRRQKRQREKERKKGTTKTETAESKISEVIKNPEDEDDENSEIVIPSDNIELVASIRAQQRVRSFSFAYDVSKNGSTKVLLNLFDNSVQLFSLSPEKQENEGLYEVLSTIDIHGHRSDIRGITLSFDDQMIASVSNDSLKIWNQRSKQCIKSCATGFGLCVIFLHGDSHVVVGTKEGHILLVELASCDIIQDIQAHEGAIWSINVRPDGKSIISGSADNNVKFWDLTIGSGGKISFAHSRTLKMVDDVLSVRYSHTRDSEKLLVAVATLDNTAKIFFDDSLKFFLSLYGHTLPILSMDISDDNELIITGSADKTIKIWGLDFGDCHRSLLAHDDSVVTVQFMPKTHLFFSCSKDKTIKYWDADTFQQILTLEGHQSEVWAITVSHSGSFVLSAGHDRSIRFWDRTEDQVFLEEEKEKQLEHLFEKELTRPRKNITLEEDTNTTEESKVESDIATQPSLESIKFGERLMEAIELATIEALEVSEYEEALKRAKNQGRALPERRSNPLLMNLSPIRYLLSTLRRIKLPDLEQTLLVLSIAQVKELCEWLIKCFESGLEVELISRCTVFLLRVHHNQITSNHEMIPTVEKLKQFLHQRLNTQRNHIGFNLAGLRHLKRSIDETKTAYVIEDQPAMKKKIRK